MRLPRLLLALPVALALTGCPGFLGLAGNTNLNPKILAVTSKEQGMTTASITLTWDGVTNAATYQVSRKVDGSAPRLIVSTDKTTLTDRVEPGHEIAYVVTAFSASGEEKANVETGPVKVSASQVGQPGALMLDGAAASGGSFVTKTGKPTLTWGEGAGATAYYVTVNENQSGKNGKLVYAALTKTTAATVGSLPDEGLKLPGYPQLKGGGLVKGTIYFYTVTAIRADNAELEKATIFDIASIDAPATISFP
ncbi:MAG TPA: hypothetical protein V6D00_12620 [Pantanalinema sp.]